ncbi:hypothetical protein [Pseudooceanicola marinus]|uniref:hypothetical protein n=1 Tax=Pseudooceanicola marinus TaxID=396013 RepID=UPI001CD36D7A|nr:hypothetical protein [Pseudooceanicola marinus]MCA1335472.1 hypothetical protein [Pseudooceanicola marinus]
MRIDPLITRSPATGASRPVTEDLLAEVYLAPRWPELNLGDRLGSGVPWSDSVIFTPAETAQTVETGLLALAKATPSLDPANVVLENLPEGRARSPVTALHDLWRALDSLVSSLNTWCHVLQSRIESALEPLRPHHGHSERPSPHAKATDGSAMRHLQDHCEKGSDPVAPAASIACYGLRDPNEEAGFAAAQAQAIPDEGRVDNPGEIGLLVPDSSAYPMALREACPDPDARFASYRSQLHAYAAMVRAKWPDKPLNGIAIYWMSEGNLSLSETLIKEAV